MAKLRPKERDKPVFLAVVICNVSNCSSHRSVLGQQGACRDEDKATETERRIKLKKPIFPIYYYGNCPN